ncbi:hypothetical protein [Microbispora sp. ATCC PTA-5024]|uniref:hypothetical protein n=1 Tax=Microbispora sp. ATCC PTA-5024 TaxID=316330 RepID=UPI0003DDCE96|nr:hypothetical protein [Microbispora sp. ATCC PTA-5024]ETK30905.1 hypothetical protein MPTA5024_37825 [Microbispora sp. ATCC PTA-5024]
MTTPHPETPEPAALSDGLSDGLFNELMAEATADGGRFDHRAHLHLTWLAVRRVGMPAAVDLVSAGIRRTARYAGAPQKYHATVSRAWVELVAHHAAHPADSVVHVAGHCADQVAQPAGPCADQAAQAADHAAGRVGARAAGDPAASGFAAFVERHPELLDKRLLGRFYRSATLAAPQARTGWVEPDLAPFPWQDPGRERTGDAGPATA